MKRVRYELEDDLARISLDDGKVNAMDLDWFKALQAALDRAEADRPQALIIEGREGVLSAGLNLRVVSTLEGDTLREFVATFGATMLRVWSVPIPTVAACTGHAIAGGAILAFACDRRFALDGEFRIQMNETRNRMSLPSWAIAICRSAIPPHAWNEALLHARAYTPREATELGMIDGVAETPEALRQRVQQVAEDYRGIHLGSYARTKERMRKPEIDAALASAEEHAPPRSR